MKVSVTAKPGEIVSVTSTANDQEIRTVPWRQILTNKEWSQCRDGLIIYKHIEEEKWQTQTNE